MSYDRARLEDDCRAWVAGATEVPLERVYWTGDEGARPAGTELAIALSLAPRPARGFPVVQAEYRVMAYTSRTWTLADGALQAPAHGLTTGDGPFAIAGAVAGSYFVIAPDADRLALAVDYFAARALVPITLPASGSGTISAGPYTISYAQPADRARYSVAALELRVEARGGPATGNGSPSAVLERLREAVDATSCPLAVVERGAVQVLGSITGTVRLEPFAFLTFAIERSNRASSEMSPIVQRVANPIVTG